MALDSGALPVALTNTVARIDFNAAMDQLNAAFPLAAANLAANAVETAKILARNVTTDRIALLAVTSAELAANAVETAKILARNVTTDRIALLAVTSAELAANAVETAKILARNVTTDRIALLAVTSAELGALACETAKINNLAITEGKIGALAVTAAKLAADAVETAKIKDLNVTLGKAALGFGRYVQRITGGWDKGLGDFTTDGTAQVNGLDLSAIVPAGAIGVVLKLLVLDGAAGSWLYIYPSAGNATCGIRLLTQVANIETAQVAVCPIDSDRLMDYQGANLAFTSIDLTVQGWFT